MIAASSVQKIREKLGDLVKRDRTGKHVEPALIIIEGWFDGESQTLADCARIKKVLDTFPRGDFNIDDCLDQLEYIQACLIMPTDWAQRLTYSTARAAFYLKEEGEPDRIDKPGDSRYLSLGLYATMTPFDIDPTINDYDRNVYWYKSGLFAAGDCEGLYGSQSILSWRELSWGVLIGRFRGYQKYQGSRWSLIETQSYKMLSCCPKKVL